MYEARRYRTSWQRQMVPSATDGCMAHIQESHLEDASMRDRILTVIANTTDPFPVEIRYHRSCWKKFISPPIYHGDNNSMPNIHL